MHDGDGGGIREGEMEGRDGGVTDPRERRERGGDGKEKRRGAPPEADGGAELGAVAATGSEKEEFLSRQFGLGVRKMKWGLCIYGFWFKLIGLAFYLLGLNYG